MLKLYPQESYDVNAGKAIEAQSLAIDNACHDINMACAGFGTNEDQLSALLGNKSASERYLISVRYAQLQGKSLVSEMKGETGGDYGQLCTLLAQPLEEAEAMLLRTATKGLGTHERLLYPVLCSRTREELAILKRAFFKLYSQDLSVVLADELSGDLKKYFLAVMNIHAHPYNPSIHTDTKAAEVADVIYKAGEGKWGTDESTFFNTLLSIPPEFLAAVNAAYLAKHGNCLTRAVEKEFSGKCEETAAFGIGMILNPIDTIADLLERTMKGWGTDESGLSAAIVRYQAFLPQVAPVYKAKYGQSLRNRVYGETSGDYQQLLIALIESSVGGETS
ncbi:Aste57867_15253 [Aphanomyces stellatus]|uniref:Annexin n=1 Tax=Aphanomyces stellatus TaxID=120398 RepID=A0A485L2Q7_9STRA|nr:hypothetical protein As57867_015197 [Aphanomyces stellatus]VFT92062.1 Aste57867_15253 [Aphanomyces stellatus]